MWIASIHSLFQMSYNKPIGLIAVSFDESSHANVASNIFEPKRNFLHRRESFLVSSV